MSTLRLNGVIVTLNGVPVTLNGADGVVVILLYYPERVACVPRENRTVFVSQVDGLDNRIVYITNENRLVSIK